MLHPLKQARLDQGLRLKDVADRAGVSTSLVSMVESGYRCPVARLDAMAQAVGASYGSFWDHK